MHAAPELVARLAEIRRSSDRQGDAVLETAVAELVGEGELQRHVRRMRQVYRGRRDRLAEALRERLGGSLSFDLPTGGIGLWARVAQGIDDEAWVEAARVQGVGLRPGRAFSADGEPLRGLRLVFSGLDEAELGQAVAALARALAAVQ